MVQIDDFRKRLSRDHPPERDMYNCDIVLDTLNHISDDLFTTNRAPTDEEQARLASHLDLANDKVYAINRKIAELKAHLQRLENQSDAILLAVAPIKRALSPFRRLPEDVIREIFVACLHDLRNPTMSNTEAPVLLTQLTSSLRKIALSMPMIWAAIHIPVVRPVEPQFSATARVLMARRVEGAREWLLRRSGNLPLRISLYDDTRVSRWDGHTNPLEEIEEVLLQCAPRWQILVLSCRAKSLPRIIALTQSDVPLLRSLSIYSLENFSMDVSEPGIGLLAAPNLMHFHVFGGIRPVSDYPIRWGNITHLHCPEIYSSTPETTSSILHILRQTTRLVSCHITVRGRGQLPSSSGPGPMISLPFLKNIVYSESTRDPDNRNPGLFELLDAPMLIALSYNMLLMINTTNVDLVEFMRRSPCIEVLTMGYIESGSLNVLMDCLRHCPSLHTFHFGAALAPGINDNINTLTWDALLDAFVRDNGALCPQLQHFVCKSPLKVSVDSVRNFVMRKCGTAQHLRRWARVKLNVMSDNENIIKFKDLVDELLDPSVSEGIELDLVVAMSPCVWKQLNHGLFSRPNDLELWWRIKVGMEAIFMTVT